ncbi:MAG: hypothetical protein ABIH18_08425 [Candidatus Omnitrophota bacterium]
MILLLSGCATGLPNLKINQTRYSSSEKSLVFGGGYFNPGRNVSYTLYFHDVATQRQYQVLVAYAALKKRTDFERRSFVIELPPGDYQISRISFLELTTWGMYTWGCDVNISFSVPTHSVVYIGNFNYTYEQKHNYFFVKTGKGYLGITDDHENAIREFREAYPKVRDDVKISLMQLNNE